MTLISTLPIIWLCIILAAIFAEAYSERLIFIWFAPSAGVAFVCGLFDMPARGQLVVFLICAVTLTSTARIARQIVLKREKNDSVDNKTK